MGQHLGGQDGGDPQITLLALAQVRGINPQTRILTTSQDKFNYSQRVLATGAQPIRVPVAGDAADQGQSINSLDDFSAFHGRLTGAGNDPEACRATPAKQVLIMDAGLIGCEFANDLASVGYKATVVDSSNRPIAAVLQFEQSNGYLAPVDIVLSAIGLRADATLAQAAGRVCERGIALTSKQTARRAGQSKRVMA